MQIIDGGSKVIGGGCKDSYYSSSTGGQVNFVHGASMSRGGKSILALNSTYTDENGIMRSKIVPVLPEVTTVSTSRNDVEYIVTEFGAVNLRGASVSKRARDLISIAHPDLEMNWNSRLKRMDGYNFYFGGIL